MIILLHGDNTQASRNELQQLKDQAKGKEIRQLEGKSLSLGDLTQALESHSLFGSDSVVVIENLFTRLGAKSAQVKKYQELLMRSSKTSTVILWEEHEVAKTTIQGLGTYAQVKSFTVPVILFRFLDELRPGNAKQALATFSALGATHASEVVFVMIVRRLRQLIMSKDGITPSGLAPWQASRLTNQAKLFTMEKLLFMHKQLLDIDYSIKTGASPFSLSQQLELFIGNC